MTKCLKRLVLLSIFFSFTVSIWAAPNEKEYCQEYLNWQLSHAKETLLSSSVERAHKKLELAFLAVFSETKGLRLKKNDEFIKLADSLSLIDKDFSNFLDHHFQYKFYKKFYKKRFKETEKLSIGELLYRWQMFQQDHPEYFKQLTSNQLIDEWDLFAADSLEQIQEMKLKNKTNYQDIAHDFFEPKNLTNGDFKNFKEKFQKTRSQFNKNERDFLLSLQEINKDRFNGFEEVCSDVINLEQAQLACILKINKSSSYLNPDLMNDLALVFENVENDLTEPEKPTPVIELPPVVIEPTPKKDPLEDIVIETPTYRTNDGKATFCKRDPNVADTIIIHHTATKISETGEDINQMHLQRKSGSEHWYMIGYNFLVKQDKYGQDAKIRFIQGRPIDMSGSHAGGSITPSSDTLELIKKEDVICGNYKNGFTTSPLASKMIDGKINANHTTIGISVIGNYSPIKYVRRGGVVLIENETGYDPKNGVRYPSEEVLKETAKLACSLQKKYPRLKKMKPHQFFKATDCPGSVKERLNKIVQYAKEFSCDFSL